MKKLKNLSYTFLGNVFFSFVKWLILILTVRLTTPEQVGSYTYAVALTTPIMLFANMRIRLRYVVEDDISFKNLHTLRNILNVLSLIIIVIIGMSLHKEYLIFMILVACTKILDLQSELYYAILHKKQNFKYISLLQIGKSLIIIVPFAITIFIFKSVLIGLIIQIVAQFVWLILFESKVTKLISKNNEVSLNKKLIFYIFLAGLPLGIVQLLNSYNILIPRYVIENILDVKLVGVFASISYLLTIIDLFMNAISQNIIVRIKNAILNKDYNTLYKYTNSYLLITSLIMGLISIIPIYLLKDIIIGVIYGSYYQNYSNIFVIIAISIIFNFQSWIFDTTLMAFKVYKLQLIASIINFIVSIFSSIVLIKSYGLMGAAISVVIINFSQSIIKYLICMYSIYRDRRG
ncbi:oligosaccharide flippase family protein [Staphylococcus haemolyticus]|uniref:oligosaccharide flippase family protein n=1 Tax=Staphylococcus haemolyticus TaxID=1283 RepID=UPI001F0A2B58|nr:oligosaccharide flippase family protein [Staphylococcus haemolyticus]MCH4388449.1 oligosaccharide flippase family protein [Staphylococcus haemolyticus]